MSTVIEKATKDFYWGILPREEMQAFVKAADEQGFDAARKTFPFSARFDYADDFSRADFHFLLPTPESAHVLDLGSGFGNVTIPISYHYEKVTAADASRELLEISRIRADELGRDNISFVHVDPLGAAPLPFPDASFDLVMLNGVLEWVGLSGETEDPRAIQGFLLSEIRRVLKPSGAVYIGIENRWFPGWWSRDPHSKLPYTVFLPRPLANWYARRKGHASYRTYVYGYGAFKRLFRERGLRIDRLLIPYTTYRDPVVIYPHVKETSSYLFAAPNAGAAFYTAKWQSFLKALRVLGADHRMIASFMFVLLPAGERAHQSSRLTRLLSARHADTYEDSDVLMKAFSKEQGTLLVEAFRTGAIRPYGRYSIVRLPDASGEISTSFAVA